MTYSFDEKMAFSRGTREEFDLSLIRNAIPNCVDVIKTDKKTDKAGIDYIATLDHGATINIDAKTRKKGAVEKGKEPPLALELWSVAPDKANGVEGKIGWTASRESNVDMILYTFDPDECEKFYLIPFQHLRMAFQRNCRSWQKNWPIRTTRSERRGRKWDSKVMFVPATVVLNAVMAEMSGIADLSAMKKEA